MTGNEISYLIEAYSNSMLAGDGPFTKRCHDWLETMTGTRKALLTHSCTAALEMAAILIDIEPGDEVIMPSYTFVSTANAFVLRGAVPVFVDIRADTLNLDETKIEEAITSRTKAIVPVHYAGVACEMDTIMNIARQYDLFVIEDTAQGIMSSYKDRALGTIGHLGTLSFHETKNIISGEGGALLVNDERFVERAEIIREKGTNRSQFFSGQVDKYTWVDIGSSYLPGELVAAFLWAQMEQAQPITNQRLKIWDWYHAAFLKCESDGLFRRPRLQSECIHNAHMYYLLLNNINTRSELIQFMEENNINTVFHYIPLHTSLAGKKYGRTSGVTENISESLVRLPIYYEMNEAQVERVVDLIKKFYVS